MDELCEYYDEVLSDEYLEHYGMPRRSGRYPWGSGKEPYQHSGDFMARVNELKKQNVTYKEEDGTVLTGERAIAKTLGMSTTDLRMQIRVAQHERRQLEVDKAKSLRSDGKSLDEIAQIMGYKNDSSVRALLNENIATNKNRANNTADTLEKMLKKNKMLDVGAGVEHELGVSEGTLKEALFILETRGYNLYGVGIPNVTNPGKQTITRVIADKDVEYADAYKNMGQIESVGQYHSTDGGTSFNKLEYPASIKSSRVKIHYGDEELYGTKGTDKDGVIEIRRGVKDLDLGNSHYAQVRILVDGTHYLKGMAMYSDDIPDGYDIVFNTNKSSGTPKTKVLKAINKDDPENPFGAAIKANGQYHYKDGAGHTKLGAINKLKEQGDWDDMSKNLSSQFLSKQPISLIKKQLNLTYDGAEAEFNEIKSLTNNTVKRKFLLDFADECDSAAQHLKAAALPRQSTKVILPMTCLKENEVYAPTYKDGEQVALVRYPHGGTFEIPILTVNNKNRKARSILDPTVHDAIGITPKTAERLSGADFDGDQVVVIPTNSHVRIKSTPPLKALENFDPKTAYATDEKVINGKTVRVNAAGVPVKIMSKEYKQKQMGQVSNLITDMTLGGAPPEELARAVKHSMVVIDAEKHKLDYKQSEKDNGIPALKKKWQSHTTEDGTESTGASTLLSRRGQDVRIPERKGSGRINKTTGEVEYKESGRTYVDKKTGQTVRATQKEKLLVETKDLHTLSSGTPQEEAYADYGNKMKALANQARKEYLATPISKFNKQANSVYSAEVASLNSKIKDASMNAPKERRAQAVANSVVKAKVEANPALAEDKKALKKVRQLAITNARAEATASGKAVRISLTDREWEAIQAGAVSSTTIDKVMRYSDPDSVKAKAMPKTMKQLTPAKLNKLKTMASSGMYTNQEIANALGCSPSTVSQYLNA